MDSKANRKVEQYLQANGALHGVLEKQVRIGNAFLDLRHEGLIREPDDKAIWIHGLFAQLIVAHVEEESQATHQVSAYAVLLMIYFLFPLPDHNIKRDIGFNHLPHAVSVLQYCQPFCNDPIIGPDLAHLKVSIFKLRISDFSLTNDRYALENTIFYYKLAFSGYHQAMKRLPGHPLLNE